MAAQAGRGARMLHWLPGCLERRLPGPRLRGGACGGGVPASAAGRRSSAGTIRSGCVPIVSNGAAVRFTHAVRIPAALAPTQSNALLVTSRNWPAGTAARPRAGTPRATA